MKWLAKNAAIPGKSREMCKHLGIYEMVSNFYYFWFFFIWLFGRIFLHPLTEDTAHGSCEKDRGITILASKTIRSVRLLTRHHYGCRWSSDFSFWFGTGVFL